MADRPLATQVARSLLLSGVGTVVSKGINVVAILVVLKLLSPEEFGTANIVLALFAIVQALTEMGLGAALVQAKAPTRSQIDGLFWLSVLVSSVLYGLLFLGAPLVAEFYDEPELTGLVRAFGLVIVLFALYFVPRNLLLKELAFDRLVIIDNAALLASGVVMIVLAYFGFGAWAIILGELSARVIMLVLYQFLHSFWPRLRFDFAEVRPLVTFGAYATGSRLLYNFYTNADYLIVGKVFGAEAVGLYTLAYRIVADPVKTLASVVNDVSFPSFSKLQDEPERLRRYFFTIARATLVGVGMLLVTIVLYIDWILELGGFEQWLPAVPLIYVLALFGIVRSVSAIVPPLLNAVGRIDQTMTFSLVGAVAMPVAFLVGTQFGLLGVAWAWVVVYPLLFGLLLFYGARVVHLPAVSFSVRTFAGLPVLLAFAAAALGLRALLATWAEGSLLLATVVGAVLTLAGGGLLLYWRERRLIAVVRGHSEPAAP
jgi:O-antigen/teichoic acid export membrane protein